MSGAAVGMIPAKGPDGRFGKARLPHGQVERGEFELAK
jgi:hypothetical protein